jgi:hypothetical protein
MKFEFTFDNLPIGYAASFHAKGSTELTPVIFSDFYTIDDGDTFVHVLEGVSEGYLSKIPFEKRPMESQISTFLAIVRKDKTCTVYVNEPIVGTMLAKRTVKAGDAVRSDDIGAVISLKMKEIVVRKNEGSPNSEETTELNIEIPKDAGFVSIISAGWRKGILFDYGPLLPKDAKDRDFNVEVALGQAWSFINFQERMKVSEAQWVEFFKQKWFPFLTLSEKLLRTMKSYAEHGANIDDLQDEVNAEVLARCPELMETIGRSEELKDHKEILIKAIEHFQKGDYISCVGLLYSRIEGVMRSWHEKIAQGKPTDFKELSKSVVTSRSGTPIQGDLLFPPNFEKFLNQVYLEHFGPGDIDKASRHTISHGVAPVSKFDLKASLLGILLLEQITYLMSIGKTQAVQINFPHIRLRKNL